MARTWHCRDASVMLNGTAALRTHNVFSKGGRLMQVKESNEHLNQVLEEQRRVDREPKGDRGAEVFETDFESDALGEDEEAGQVAASAIPSQPAEVRRRAAGRSVPFRRGAGRAVRLRDYR